MRGGGDGDEREGPGLPIRNRRERGAGGPRGRAAGLAPPLAGTERGPSSCCSGLPALRRCTCCGAVPRLPGAASPLSVRPGTGCVLPALRVAGFLLGADRSHRGGAARSSSCCEERFVSGRLCGSEGGDDGLRVSAR